MYKVSLLLANTLSFILTMWYVNKGDTGLQGERGERFILTMWYVNFAIKKTYVSIEAMFYINYVVCKYLSLFCRLDFLFCFILTMWYVNLSIALIQSISPSVLY